MSKVLVLGGAGYVGDSLTDELLKNNHDVTVYDNLLFETEYRKSGVKFIFGDVRDTSKLKNALKRIDVVYALAATVGDGMAATNPIATLEINRESIRWLSENFNGKIIFLSSCSTYGSGDGILNEDSNLNPLSLYASSKLESEKILKDSQSQIYRLGTLFGNSGNVARIRLDLFINTIVFKAFYEKKIKIFGGDQYRPFLHVKDVGKQLAKGANSNAVGIYNLHYQNARLLDIAYQVRAHFNDINIEITDIPTEDFRNYRVSSDKAKLELGFNPIYTIDDGINELKELFLSGRIKNPYDIRYHNHNFIKERPEYLDFKVIEEKRNLVEELKNKKLTSVV